MAGVSFLSARRQLWAAREQVDVRLSGQHVLQATLLRMLKWISRRGVASLLKMPLGLYEAIGVGRGRRAILQSRTASQVSGAQGLLRPLKNQPTPSPFFFPFNLQVSTSCWSP